MRDDDLYEQNEINSSESEGNRSNHNDRNYPKPSLVGYDYSVQRSTFDWLHQQRKMRGASWTRISKDICQYNKIDWTEKFSWMIANWARNIGIIKTPADFEYILRYRDARTSEEKMHAMSSFDSKDLLDIINMHLFKGFSHTQAHDFESQIQKRWVRRVKHLTGIYIGHDTVDYGTIYEDANFDLAKIDLDALSQCPAEYSVMSLEGVVDTATCLVKMIAFRKNGTIRQHYSGIFNAESNSCVMLLWDMENWECTIQNFLILVNYNGEDRENINIFENEKEFWRSEVVLTPHIPENHFMKLRLTKMFFPLKKIFNFDIVRKDALKEAPLLSSLDNLPPPWRDIYGHALRDLAAMQWRIVE